jgi:hypothetical protein
VSSVSQLALFRADAPLARTEADLGEHLKSLGGGVEAPEPKKPTLGSVASEFCEETTFKKKGLFAAIAQYVPILRWAPIYKGEWLAKDVLAGLILGIMMVPQGMAYAMLAGMPPVYGIYSSLSPTLVYMAMGTCPQLAVGTNAPISLLVADSIYRYLPAHSFYY